MTHRHDSDPVRNQPFPGDETAHAKQPHPTIAGRYSDGTVMRGFHGPAFKHGRYTAAPPPLPPAEGESIDRHDPPTATTKLREELASDQGGDMTTGKRLLIARVVELEAVGRVIAQNLVADGVLTARGRPRSAVNAYLAVVASQERILARLGLEPRRRDVVDLSLQDYLTQTQHDQGGKAHDPLDSAATPQTGQTEQTAATTEPRR